jgi:hypothetical protein
MTGCLLTLAVFLYVPAIIYKAYAICVLWELFVVPFFNLPSLTIAYCIGISMTMSYLTGVSSIQSKMSNLLDNKEKETDEKCIEVIVIWIVEPTAMLGISWIVKQFV